MNFHLVKDVEQGNAMNPNINSTRDMRGHNKGQKGSIYNALLYDTDNNDRRCTNMRPHYIILSSCTRLKHIRP